MSSEIMIRYAVVFFFPTIYLFMLATFVFARSYHLKIAKIISAFLLCGAIGFTFDFVRVLAPLEYNPMIHLFIVLPMVYLGFSLMVHMIYILVNPIKKIPLPFMPYLLYVIPIIMFIYCLVETFILGHPTYYKMDGWVYRENNFFIDLSVTLSILLYSLNLVLLYVGLKHTKSKEMRRFFTTCFIFTIVCVIGLIRWNAGWLDIDYVLPPTNSLFLILLTGTLLGFLIRKIVSNPSILKRYASLIETSPTPTIFIDTNKTIIEVNTMAENMFQIKEKTKLEHYFGFYKNEELLEQLFLQLEERRYIKGFEVVYYDEWEIDNHLLIDASVVHIGEETVYYLMIHDITIEYKQRKVKDYLAYHDSLTGIYNRAYFEKYVRQQLQELQHKKGKGALLVCDLNFFKQINDTHGHQVGDYVLVYATELFKKYLPRPNILARLGGDEFIVFFELIPSKQMLLGQIENVRNQFLKHPYQEGDLTIEVVPSMGIAFTIEDGYSFNGLYRNADLRMYENKKILKAALIKED